jgi:quercetin dioxygenase-like cupin family protein
VTVRHVVGRAAEGDFRLPDALAPGSEGYERWSCVDGTTPGAVHTGFGVCRLEPGGTVPAHVHSFEESVHVLDGEVVLQTPGAAVRLAPGDYGLIPVGVPHAWRNAGTLAARWAEMLAPQPRERYDADTYRVADLLPTDPVPVDPRDPRTRSYGSVHPEHMDPAKQSQELLAVSASMRTALLVYSGITVKMMVDTDLGAVLSTMFMVQYTTAGRVSTHDHPFEETYLILDGEVDASFDGETYRLSPGDVAWAGAGCVHGFAAVGGPVRWLETQAPQPPSRHSYRYTRDWDYLREALARNGEDLG